MLSKLNRFFVGFLAGLLIGLYSNSDKGAEHGYKVGAWTREILTKEKQ
jgi:hypothetical protein